VKTWPCTYSGFAANPAFTSMQLRVRGQDNRCEIRHS
jgi:hypothetical protein